VKEMIYGNDRVSGNALPLSTWVNQQNRFCRACELSPDKKKSAKRRGGDV